MQFPALGQYLISDAFYLAIVVFVFMSLVGLTDLGAKDGTVFELISETHDHWPYRLKAMRNWAKLTLWCGFGLALLDHLAGYFTIAFGLALLWMTSKMFIEYRQQRQDEEMKQTVCLCEAEKAYEKIRLQLPPFGEGNNSVAMNVDTLEFVIGPTLKQTEDLAEAKWPDEMHRVYIRSL